MTTIRKRTAARRSSEEQQLKNRSSDTGQPSTNKDDGSSTSRSSSQTEDDLSFLSLIPAIIICTLVSIASYFSCESIDLAEDIIVATIRTFVQLSLLAALLSPLFRIVENHHHNSTTGGRQHISSRYSAPIMVLAYVMCFMLPLAAYEASSRSKLTLRPTVDNNNSNSNNTVFLIVITALFIAVSTMATIAIFIIIKPTPLYSPRHVIPLCGMLFNNSLSSISLALDILFTELQSKHD